MIPARFSQPMNFAKPTNVLSDGKSFEQDYSFEILHAYCACMSLRGALTAPLGVGTLSVVSFMLKT